MAARPLTDIQTRFCDAVLAGQTPSQALKTAGYRVYTDPATVLAQSAVVSRLRTAVAVDLASLSPLAVQTLRSLMLETSISPAVRLDAAKTVLDRTGYASIPHSAQLAGAKHELASMSRDELLKIIDSCKNQLAERATLVGEITTDSGSPSQLIDLM